MTARFGGSSLKTKFFIKSEKRLDEKEECYIIKNVIKRENEETKKKIILQKNLLTKEKTADIMKA